MAMDDALDLAHFKTLLGDIRAAWVVLVMVT